MTPGAQDLIRERREAVTRVLSEYLHSHACICAWPQFRFWAGKEQGPGWQDNIQNDLVEAVLDLPFIHTEPPSHPEFWLENDASCSVCGARWKHFRVEWRMLAFQDSLVPWDASEAVPAGGYGLLISGSICSTVGHEPEEGRQMLTTGEWIEFMLGRPYRTESFAPTTRHG